MVSAQTIWTRVQNIPPFIASLIAIIAAILAVITWIMGYFATQQQLKEVKCTAYINNTMISRQLDQKIYYDEYVKMKVQIAELEKKQKSSLLAADEQSRLQEFNTKTSTTLDSMKEARKKAKRLLDIIHSGDVVNPDGTCKE